MTTQAPFLSDIFPPESENKNSTVLFFEEIGDIAIAGVTMHHNGWELWAKTRKDARAAAKSAAVNKPLCYHETWQTPDQRMVLYPGTDMFVSEDVCCVCDAWKEDCNDERECMDCCELLDEKLETPIAYLVAIEDRLQESETPEHFEQCLFVLNLAKRHLVGQSKAFFLSNQLEVNAMLDGVYGRAA